MPTLLHCNSGTTEGRERPGRRQPGDADPAVTAPNVLRQIEACMPALRRHAIALLRSREAADELVRDCLVRALDGLNTRRGEPDVRAWLFTTMQNLFISRQRRRRFLPGAGARRAAHSPCPSADAGQPWRELMRGLERLPADQRSAVLLVAVEDLSYRDAATVLGVPADRMMSLLARGRERLRQFTGADAGPPRRRVRWAVTPAA